MLITEFHLKRFTSKKEKKIDQNFIALAILPLRTDCKRHSTTEAISFPSSYITSLANCIKIKLSHATVSSAAKPFIITFRYPPHPVSSKPCMFLMTENSRLN